MMLDELDAKEKDLTGPFRRSSVKLYDQITVLDIREFQRLLQC